MILVILYIQHNNKNVTNYFPVSHTNRICQANVRWMLSGIDIFDGYLAW